MVRGAVLGGLVICLAACESRPAWKPSDALERSARVLKHLDRLEADLHGSEAETLTYNVLVQRHAQATEFACKVSQEHVQDIERLAAIQERKIEQKRAARAVARRKKAVAQLLRKPRSGT